MVEKKISRQGHKARGQRQGHKKKSAAKDRIARGQGQEPRTQMQVFS